METSLGENVEQLRSDEELFFDYDPTEDDEGSISRVQELENILGEILDLWDEEELGFTVTTVDYQAVNEVMDRAGAVLNNDESE